MTGLFFFLGFWFVMPPHSYSSNSSTAGTHTQGVQQYGSQEVPDRIERQNGLWM